MYLNSEIRRINSTPDVEIPVFCTNSHRKSIPRHLNNLNTRKHLGYIRATVVPIEVISIKTIKNKGLDQG